MRHEPATNTIQALLLYDPRNIVFGAEILGPALQIQTEPSGHPLGLPVHIVEQLIEHCTAIIHYQSNNLDMVQEVTGQYSERNHDIDLGTEWLNLDFTELTTSLNMWAESTTHQVWSLKGLETCLPVLKRWGTNLVDSHSGGGDRDSIPLAQSMILSRIEYLQGVIVASLIHAECVEKRVVTYRQLVSSLRTLELSCCTD